MCKLKCHKKCHSVLLQWHLFFNYLLLAVWVDKDHLTAQLNNWTATNTMWYNEGCNKLQMCTHNLGRMLHFLVPFRGAFEMEPAFLGPNLNCLLDMQTPDLGHSSLFMKNKITRLKPSIWLDRVWSVCYIVAKLLQAGLDWEQLFICWVDDVIYNFLIISRMLHTREQRSMSAPVWSHPFQNLCNPAWMTIVFLETL